MTTNPLVIAQRIQARLDESKSDPKWLNDEMKALAEALEAGNVATVTITEKLARDQIAAIDRFSVATLDAAKRRQNTELAKLNAPLKKAAAPRDPNYIALAMFTAIQKGKIELGEDLEALGVDVEGVVGKCWDMAETFLAVSREREAQYVADRRAELEAARAKAAVEAETGAGAGQDGTDSGS